MVITLKIENLTVKFLPSKYWYRGRNRWLLYCRGNVNSNLWKGRTYC